MIQGDYSEITRNHRKRKGEFMRNITDILIRYLSDINLPSVSIIDVIEICLITFLYISLWCGSNSREHILC